MVWNIKGPRNRKFLIADQKQYIVFKFEPYCKFEYDRALLNKTWISHTTEMQDGDIVSTKNPPISKLHRIIKCVTMSDIHLFFH